MAQEFDTVDQKSLSAASLVLDQNFETLRTSFSGTSAPDLVEGQIWYSEITNEWFGFDGTTEVPFSTGGPFTPLFSPSTERAVVIFNDTSGNLAETTVEIDASDNMTGVNNFTATGNVSGSGLSTTGAINADGDITSLSEVSGATLNATNASATATNLGLSVARQLEQLGTGLVAKNTGSTVTARSFDSANGLSWTNDDGVGGNPSIDFDATTEMDRTSSTVTRKAGVVSINGSVSILETDSGKFGTVSGSAGPHTATLPNVFTNGFYIYFVANATALTVSFPTGENFEFDEALYSGSTTDINVAPYSQCLILARGSSLWTVMTLGGTITAV